MTYEVTITNRGTKAARQVAVVVNFSDGIDPVSVEGATAEIGGGQALLDPIVSMGAGEAVKVKITAKASKGGSHLFAGEKSCTDPETRLASEQTTRYSSGSPRRPRKPPTPARPSCRAVRAYAKPTSAPQRGRAILPVLFVCDAPSGRQLRYSHGPRTFGPH